MNMIVLLTFYLVPLLPKEGFTFPSHRNADYEGICGFSITSRPYASISPAGAGFFFVEKKDKSLRSCIDCQRLNNITIKNRSPLISLAFQLLQGAKVFTKLDLRNAYPFVRIREGDKWKTAFNTPSGHYKNLVMPFGLTNAPAFFQALVKDVLRDMLNVFVFVVCLDDILILSPGEQSHSPVRHICLVRQRFLDHQLFVKANKCEFHKSTLSFMGFIVSDGITQMDPGNVAHSRNPQGCGEAFRVCSFLYTFY